MRSDRNDNEGPAGAGDVPAGRGAFLRTAMTAIGAGAAVLAGATTATRSAEAVKIGGDDDGHKKRRKKGSKSRQGSDVASKPKRGLLIIDDEADMAVPDRKKVDKAWEDEEAEEEKPVMVLDDPQDEKVAEKGSWTTVGGDDHHTRPNTIITEDASPPRRRKRHDSSDEGASPPRRNPEHGTDMSGRGGTREDASPPRRRQRHASPASDDSPPRRNPSGLRHGDSRAAGSDASPPRRNRGGEGRGGGKSREDASPPRKPRPPDTCDDGADMATSSVKRGGRSRQRDDASPHRRRRHDSSDDDNSPPRRKSSHGGRNGRSRSPVAEAARDASSPRRQKNAEREVAAVAEADSDPSPPRRQNRESDGGRERSRDDRESRRRRHDSLERGAGNGSSAKGMEGDRESGGGREDRRAKTATGYYAGLQSGKDFKVVEQELRRKHDADMKGADPAASGQGATTVCRHKKGRKLDMLNEFMRQQDAKEGKKVAAKEAQFEWGRGKVQKEQDKEWKEEIENIAAEPFARTIDDSRLEAARKAEIRPDDPMAAYIAKKQVKQKAKSGVPAKPEYKGPPPKPNRFNIRPGYRWDGVDRGNGWEDKVVAKAVDSRYKADLAYKWATADM